MQISIINLTSSKILLILTDKFHLFRWLRLLRSNLCLLFLGISGDYKKKINTVILETDLNRTSWAKSEKSRKSWKTMAINFQIAIKIKIWHSTVTSKKKAFSTTSNPSQFRVKFSSGFLTGAVMGGVLLIFCNVVFFLHHWKISFVPWSCHIKNIISSLSWMFIAEIDLKSVRGVWDE